MKDTQLLADLQALDELFSDETKWIKHRSASNRAGTFAFVSCLSDDAVAWCLAGGMGKVTNFDAPGSYSNRFMPMSLAIEKIEPNYINFNDKKETTFSDIKSLIKKVIENEKKH